ncbi:MAG: phosphoglycolate phosphatase [Candidatus Latescibacterota bacterium]
MPIQKPDPAGIHIAIDRLGCNRSDVIYVGDSITDAETAQRSHVRFIAVISGTTPNTAFEPYSPFTVIEDMAELPGVLAN